MSNNFHRLRLWKVLTAGTPCCCSNSQVPSTLRLCHLLGCWVIELVLRCPCKACLDPTVFPQLLDEFNQLRRHVAIIQICFHVTEFPFIFLRRNFSEYSADILSSLSRCAWFTRNCSVRKISLFFPCNCAHLCILLQVHFPLVSAKLILRLWYGIFCFLLFSFIPTWAQFHLSVGVLRRSNFEGRLLF